MIECIILGDSIAVGTHMVRPECVIMAKSGFNSYQWRKKYLESGASELPLTETAIISLGSNDHKGVKTLKELATIRKNVRAKRVYWILPAGNLKASGVDIKDIQAVVNEIALGFGDIVLPITRLQADKVHPSTLGYKELADKTRITK
jgi:hypothetical protein